LNGLKLPRRNGKANRSITFTTAAPTNLPSKFLRPIGYQLNRDWAVINYADVDPRPNVRADYRSGPY